MIYLRIAGGLGNQLFQVTAAVYCSQLLGLPISIVSAGLSRYKAKREPLFLQIISGFPGLTCISAPSSISSFFADKLRVGRLPLPFISINDRNFFERVPNRLHGLPRFMDGYFQSCWHPGSFAQSVAHLKVVPAVDLPHLRLAIDDVGVHVRGSDFLADSGFSLAGSDFYIKSVGLAFQEGYRSFVFFTDDPQYCNRIISAVHAAVPGVRLRLAQSSSAIADFNSLRLARSRIVGNSTFAWWATALSAYNGPTWTTSHFTAWHRKPFLLPGEVYID
jgi:hypothetical protein